MISSNFFHENHQNIKKDTNWKIRPRIRKGQKFKNRQNSKKCFQAFLARKFKFRFILYPFFPDENHQTENSMIYWDFFKIRFDKKWCLTPVWYTTRWHLRKTPSKKFKVIICWLQVDKWNRFGQQYNTLILRGRFFIEQKKNFGRFFIKKGTWL